MYWLHIIHYVGFTGAQLFNGILVYLIIKRAGKLFGSYRNVILFFTLSSMFFSFVEIICQPLQHTKGPMFVVFLEYNQYLPKAFEDVMIRFHCGIYGYVIAVLTAQFFFRYIVLCKPELLVYFKGIKLFTIFIPSFLVCFALYALTDWGLSPTPEKQLFLKEDLGTMFDQDSYKVSFVAPLYWSAGPNGEKHWNFKDTTASILGGFILSSHTFCIILFAIKIFLHMKTARVHMSKKTLELNNQLFIMLIAQSIIPFCLMYTPVGMLMFLPMFNIGMGGLENFSSASVVIYPSIEPLIAMYCISDFRKRIISFLCCKGSLPKKYVSDVSNQNGSNPFPTSGR